MLKTAKAQYFKEIDGNFAPCGSKDEGAKKMKMIDVPDDKLLTPKMFVVRNMLFISQSYTN